MKQELDKPKQRHENLKNELRKRKFDSTKKIISDDVIIMEDRKVVVDSEGDSELLEKPEEDENMEVDVSSLDKIEVKNVETPDLSKENPVSPIQIENSVENTLPVIEKSKSDENYEFLKGIENSIDSDKRFEDKQMEIEFPREKLDILSCVHDFGKGAEELDFLSTVEKSIEDYDFNSFTSEPLNLGSKPTRKFLTAAELKEIPDSDHRLSRTPISPPSSDFDSNELKGAYGPIKSITPLVTPAMRKENSFQSFSPTNPLVFPSLDDERDDRFCANGGFSSDLPPTQDTQFNYHPPDCNFQPDTGLGDFGQHISQVLTDPTNLPEEGADEGGKNVVVNKTGNEKLVMIFPFIESFQKLGRQQLGIQSLPALETLMSTYLSHISLAVENCYGKPAKAARLKSTISDTLLFFHMVYTEIKQPLEQSSYLDKMSDLLAFYIDMEIKASVRCTEYPAKIGSKITMSLFLFLEKSQDHILDTILKTKFMVARSFWELCAPIFNRILEVPRGVELDDLTYTRYLLVFKMWMKCMEMPEDRPKIMKIAENRLTPPPNFAQSIKSGVLRGIFPRLRKSRPDITLFLMEAKFCIKTKTSEFFKAIGDLKNRNSSLPLQLDKGLFFQEDKDGDNNEEQDDGIMTNIWSSMESNSTTVKKQIRMANVVKPVKKKKSRKEIALENRKMRQELNKLKQSRLENLKNESRKRKFESVSSTNKEEIISDDDDVIVIEDPKVVVDLEGDLKSEEPNWNLPLKKRKATMPPARKESVDEISYPSTPMLSIAALEDCKMVNYYPKTYPSIIDDGLMTNIWSTMDSNSMTVKEQIKLANAVNPVEQKKSLKEIKEIISDDDDVMIIEHPKIVVDLEADTKSPEKPKEDENLEVDVSNLDKIEVKNVETPDLQKENPVSPKQVENNVENSVENPLPVNEKSQSDENCQLLKEIEVSIDSDKRFEDKEMEIEFPKEKLDILSCVGKGAGELDLFSTVKHTLEDYDFNSVNNSSFMSEPLNLGSKPTRKFPTAAELKEIPDTDHRPSCTPIFPPSNDFDNNELKGAYGPIKSIVPLVTPAMRKENSVQSFNPSNPLVFPSLDDERDDRFCVNGGFNSDLPQTQDTQFNYHPPDCNFQPNTGLRDFCQHISQDLTDPMNLPEEGMWLHRVVVHRDSFMFNLLRIVRKFVLESLDIKDVRVPNPPENLQPSDPSTRCGCLICKDNLKRMWANYLLLQKNKKNKEFTPERKNLLDTIENEIKDYLIKSETEEPKWNLPFKKRKAMMPPARKESVDEISYPSTPMLSIAALEDCKMVNSYLNLLKSMKTTRISSTRGRKIKILYPRTYPSVIMQFPSPSTSSSPDATIDASLYSEPQPHLIPPVDFHATQTLMPIDANSYDEPRPYRIPPVDLHATQTLMTIDANSYAKPQPYLIPPVDLHAEQTLMTIANGYVPPPPPPKPKSKKTTRKSSTRGRKRKC